MEWGCGYGMGPGIWYGAGDMEWGYGYRMRVNCTYPQVSVGKDMHLLCHILVMY